MEMPINIIVILFVAVVVGGILIVFAEQNLTQAQQRLNEQFEEEGLSENEILDIDAASETTIIALADECIEQNKGAVELRTCFALFANSFPDLSSMNGRALSNGFILDTRAAPEDPSAIRVSYDPRGNVTVT